MSIECVLWVMERSRAKGKDQLVLLRIAHHCPEDGSGAVINIPTLMKETGQSDRAIRYSIDALSDPKGLAELEAVRYAGPRGSNRYRILMDSQPLAATGAARDTDDDSSSGTTCRKPTGKRCRKDSLAAPVAARSENPEQALPATGAARADDRQQVPQDADRHDVPQEETEGSNVRHLMPQETSLAASGAARDDTADADRHVVPQEENGGNTRGESTSSPSPESPVDPGNSKTEIPEGGAGGTKRRGKGVNLAPLFDAFTAAGVTAPQVTKFDAPYAGELLTTYGAGNVVACWKAIGALGEKSDFGDRFLQKNRNFRYLATHNTVGIWLDSRSVQSDVSGGSNGQQHDNGSNHDSLMERVRAHTEQS